MTKDPFEWGHIDRGLIHRRLFDRGLLHMVVLTKDLFTWAY